MRKFVSIVFEHFLSHAAAKKCAKNLKSLHLFYSQDKKNIDILYINRIRLDQISDPYVTTWTRIQGVLLIFNTKNTLSKIILMQHIFS